jgi:hypothetical protein
MEVVREQGDRDNRKDQQNNFRLKKSLYLRQGPLLLGEIFQRTATV